MTLENGDALGELSFLEKRSRNITVKCLTNCTLASIDT